MFLRTASKTAALHKNFAAAIICCQLTFMLGIDKIYSEVVRCQPITLFCILKDIIVIKIRSKDNDWYSGCFTSYLFCTYVIF